MFSHTMMELPLTLTTLHRRMGEVLGHVEVVSRRPDKSFHTTTFGAIAARAEKLARGLLAMGIARGDRVATLMWNHAEHLEAYLGIPLAGAVIHTLNLRLHPDDIAYIANDAADRVLIVDAVLLPLYEKFADKVRFERVIVVGRDYEAFLDAAPPLALPALAESDPLGMCYTSGTTGRPKGVVYSHRSTLLHSLVSALPDSLRLSRSDTLFPVVPMFHVNAWGLPYTAALVGARLAFPGPHLDPVSLLEVMESQHVTIAAGVPTLWLGIREALDKEPARWKLHPGLTMIVGGAAAPERLIRDFDRQGLSLLHAWGMTETSPIGLVSRLPPELDDAPEALRYQLRAKQGVPPPLVEIAIRKDGETPPADGRSSGELLVRAPWVAARYSSNNTPDRWSDDGYFRTGDVAHRDAHGFVQLTDRTADLIKSGGEWIASQELENALMGHPAVREAAVIGLAHPKWSERPLAVVVKKPDAEVTEAELRAYLAEKFIKFWLPDVFVFTDTIPRTSTGKFQKTTLRAQFAGYQWPGTTD
ncbi:MAG: long-chain fatty acid--CoA ligase [Myxococcales bacterium]|nr:long-chain fatty acid--CoA ligase [Myxococcales bacterium]